MNGSRPAVIELVDAEILARSGDGTTLRTPGYALLDEQGIATGAPALARAWLYPQRSFSQFWRQLTLAPLPVESRHARHYADLAFAQLREVHRELGAPEEIIFLLPGSYSREQLSILLGLVNALPATTTAMVDNAVAAVSTLGYSGNVVHVDIQLHQAVITHLQAGEEVSRLTVETVPDAGLRAFHGAWSQAIADQFIEQYRYDPLHLAEDEQQLNDRLPEWLAALDSGTQATAELQSRRGSFRINLNRETLESPVATRIDRLQAALAKLPADHRVASHRLLRLPGVVAALSLEVLEEDRGLRGGQRATDLVTPGQSSAPYVTALPADSRGEARQVEAVPQAPDRPSHVLLNHRAIAIGAGLGLRRTPGGIGTCPAAEAELWLSPLNGRVSAQGSGENGGTVRGDLRPGDTLTLGGHTLTLITVDRES